MKLPRLDNPPAYAGLYVFDFGESTAVGYTADEIAVLLNSGKFPQGKAYKIHRAYPDGRMELRGVSPVDHGGLETGIFFCSDTPEQAEADYAGLVRLTQEHPAPGRAKLRRGTLPGSGYRHVVALIYPAEFDAEWAAWLLARNYNGGQIVDAGSGHVTDFYARGEVAEGTEIAGAAGRAGRSPEEVLAAVGNPVQRSAV